MTITKKILGATLPFFLFFGGVVLYLGITSLNKQGEQSLEMIHTTMLNDRKEKLKDLVRNTFEILRTQYRTAHDPALIAEAYRSQLNATVNLAFSTVEAIYNDTTLSEAEKQAKALKTVKSMRYDGNNYLWINDLKPKMVMHPMKPALDGKNLSDFKDPNGKHLFMEMVKTCKENGEGFVDYMWPKPGADKPVPKLSYVRLFKPWNWVIGSGVYLETVEQHFMEEAKRQIGELRYGKEGDDYFFIIDNKMKMVMHPIKPKLNGNDLSDFRDPKGKALFVDMVETCQKGESGFVDYMWPKPGQQEPVDKLSYVQLFKEWNWIVGTGIYIDDINETMNRQAALVNGNLSRQEKLITSIVVAMILVVGGIITFMATRIAKPIRETDYFFTNIAEGEGDLTGRLKVATKDEVGQMARSFNSFADKLQGMVGYIAEESLEINKSSSELSTISSDLSNVARETLEKSNGAAESMEVMSGNMEQVASSMEEAAANVNAVAEAIEQMTITINEIAETSEKARAITQKAVSESSSASTSVDALGSAASEITAVLETITEISQQVDLLALNATIEAARAGDAGKGFAVVANEIKDLANQTAQATDQIRARIESIQQTTTTTVSVIQGVSTVVEENSDIVNNIATAVEEQSLTAREISENVQQISDSIQEVNLNVTQSSEMSRSVAGQISDINNSSKRMNNNAQQVDENSKALDFLAQSLDKLVSSYKYK